jgi:hypothetical protein
MTAIIGISAFYHDSAAVIVVDGSPVAADRLSTTQVMTDLVWQADYQTWLWPL